MRINETAPPVQSGAAPAGPAGAGRPAGRSGVRYVPPRVGGLLAKVPPPWRLPLVTYLVCQLILLFWWAAFYPGLMNADSINFVLHVTTGPWINNASVLYDFLVLVSLKLTGDLGLLTLAQTVATAAALAYTVYAFRRLGVPGRWTAIAAAIVVALPPEGSFIIFVWKDVPFTICAYLLVPTLAHLLSLRDLPNWRRHPRVNRLLVAIGLELLGVCLFRQDGVVITGLTAVGLVILLAGFRGRLAALAAGAIFLTFLLNLVIFPAVGIKLPSRSLLFGPANADIAVVYAEAPQTFTAADQKLMEKVVPLAEWKASGAYPRCYNSNYTTFLRNFDNNASRVSTPLFKLWLRTLKRTPQLVIGARICRGSIAWLAFRRYLRLPLLLPGQPVGLGQRAGREAQPVPARLLRPAAPGQLREQHGDLPARRQRDAPAGLAAVARIDLVVPLLCDGGGVRAAPQELGPAVHGRDRGRPAAHGVRRQSRPAVPLYDYGDVRRPDADTAVPGAQPAPAGAGQL
jgi:hypothetical protein